MEYSIDKLSKMAGVSKRTLRYYDELGLLSPARISNGYRVYGAAEVDLLQQILFYRELGVALEEIKKIVQSKDFDRDAALKQHLAELVAKRERLDELIGNVEKTILSAKGEVLMKDNEKFNGFKQQILDENEQKYGAEIREKYGAETVEKSNQKLMGLTKEQYAETERLSLEIAQLLKIAFEEGDPTSKNAQKVCQLHKEWLGYFWHTYSKEAHAGLAQMYVDDPRFAAHYDKNAPGCAVFLRDALLIYCR